MTTERSGMSLEQVRDSIREESKFQRTTKHHVTCTLMDIWANAIDAHLSRDAVVSDVEVVRILTIAGLLEQNDAVLSQSGKKDVARLLRSFANWYAAVPDAITEDEAKWSCRSNEYMRGWNACRQAMLAQRDGGTDG